MKKVTKTYPMDNLRFIEFQLNLLFNYPHKQITDTEVRILAYVFLFKTSAEQKLLDDKVFQTYPSLNNYLSKLRKKKLLLGERQYKPTKLEPILNEKIKLYNPNEPVEFNITWI